MEGATIFRPGFFDDATVANYFEINVPEVLSKGGLGSVIWKLV